MIQAVILKKTKLELLLDIIETISPSWRELPIYMWQWDTIERKHLDPFKVYDLAAFSIAEENGFGIVSREENFVVQYFTGSFANVVSNIIPPDDFLDNPNELNEIVLGDLFRLQ